MANLHNSEQEIWKFIESISLRELEVSSFGRIRNKLTKHIYALRLDKSKGYLRVKVKKDGQRIYRPVHRLVALAFIDNPQNKPAVNHKDCDKTNNRVDNLEWVTVKENNQHASVNGRLSKKKESDKRGKHMKGRFGVLHGGCKKVKQLSKEGKLIRVWDSMADIARAGIAPKKDVGQCCLGHQKTCYGFKWQYA